MHPAKKLMEIGGEDVVIYNVKYVRLRKEKVI